MLRSGAPLERSRPRSVSTGAAIGELSKHRPDPLRSRAAATGRRRGVTRLLAAPAAPAEHGFRREPDDRILDVLRWHGRPPTRLAGYCSASMLMSSRPVALGPLISSQ